MSDSTAFNNGPNGVRPSPQSTEKFDRTDCKKRQAATGSLNGTRTEDEQMDGPPKPVGAEPFRLPGIRL